MNTALHIATEVWRVVLMMAPYLLLGFAVAGVLSVVLTPAWVARHLGGRGSGQVVKAALLGVPLPLCSCGVLPLAFSLRRDGASKGATVSFLASTPQTGVDSILLTWSLLGPVIAAARVIAAFASGVLAGLLTDRVGNGERASPAADAAPAALVLTARPASDADKRADAGLLRCWPVGFASSNASVRVETPDGAAIYRLWAPNTAPPAATASALLIHSDSLVRGNLGGIGWLGWTLIGAGVAAAIAIPLILDDDDDAS